MKNLELGTTYRELSNSESRIAHRIERVHGAAKSYQKGLMADAGRLASELDPSLTSRSEWSDGRGDAFRHAFASAVMTCEKGVIASFLMGLAHEANNWLNPHNPESWDNVAQAQRAIMDMTNNSPVSYTHLTLPTIYSV